MADASIDKRELSSLYCIWAEMDGPFDQRIIPDPIQPKKGVTKRYKGIWQKNGTWPGLNAVDRLDDVFAFQHQGQVMKKWLSSQGFPTNGWKYGIWEKNITSFIEASKNSAKVTYFMDDVWDLFTPQQKGLFGKQKKDSWNPADVYISSLSSGEESSALRKLKKLANDTDELTPAIFVALVNEYLRGLYHAGKVIGISLKAAKYPNIPHVKTRNIAYDSDFEPPNFGEATLTKPIHQYMAVGSEKKNMDFRGNSLKFEVNISMSGCDPLEYYWESKSPGLTGAPTTEMKDVVGTHDPLKNQLANARTGGIPKPILKKLIKQYSGLPKWDYAVPNTVVKSNSSRETLSKHWAKFITNLKRDGGNLVKLDDFEIYEKDGSKIQPTAQSKSYSNNELYQYWVTTVLEIDAMSEKEVLNTYGWKKGKKFRDNMRGKFRNLNTIRSMITARNNKKLGEYLVRAYYAASKMRFDVEELQAPFVKIQ